MLQWFEELLVPCVRSIRLAIKFIPVSYRSRRPNLLLISIAL